MPFARVSPRAPMEPAPSRAVRRLRFAGTAILVVVGLACALLLAVRFVVFPQVESRRADIAALLSARLGQAVTIDEIVTGWDGWNPRLSIRGLTIRDRAGARTTPLLELPRVDLIVAWTSLPFLDFRLRELVVEGPRLSVRRDVQGRLRIAGIALEPDTPADDGMLTDWLLRQREIVVRDALIVWDDEMRNAPQLVLDRVQFRLERSLGHHRFGLTGVPPAELASPVDVRGDVVGLDPGDWRKTQGRFYLRLDYADVAAWREWLPLPIPVESGKGALRFWIDVADGQASDVVADLELADVDARVDAALPPLRLRHLAGRVGWKTGAAKRSLYGRGVAFQTTDGVTLPPTDLTVAYDVTEAGEIGTGELAFPRLDLAPLTAVASHLPLPQTLRDDLGRFAPRGTLVGGKAAWTGPPDAPQSYVASATAERVGVNANDTMPGIDGVSGVVEVSEGKGSLKLASRTLTVTMPRWYAEPVALDALSGSVSWQRGPQGVTVTASDLAFANTDGAGTAAATWRSLPAGPGFLDLHAQVARLSFERGQRYLPLTLHEHLREWLQRALGKGNASDARIVLNGNLADFPFRDGKGGQLVVTARANGATLDYAERWPVVSDVDADVRIDGTKLVVDATRGRIMGAQIGRARAEIADLHDPRPVLRISGDVAGPTSEFVAFIAATPVTDWIGHFTERVTATGDGRLALRFDLPLKEPGATSVTGEYQFIGNGLAVGSAPPLTQVSGKLGFSDATLSGTDITAQVFGGPVKLQFAGADNRVRVTATGTTDVANLRATLASPLADRIAGTADWQVVINARPDIASWVLDSSLKGTAVDLPAPLGKTADQAMALRVERRQGPAPRRDDIVSVDYGGVARLQARAPSLPDARADRMLLVVGKGAERPVDAERNGLWVRADLPKLNVDDWLAIGRTLTAPAAPVAGGSAAAAGGEAPIALEGADLRAGTMQALGRKFNDMGVVARRHGEDWRLTLDGREVAGTAVWGGPTPIRPNGRVVARLARLTAPDAGDLVPWKPPASDAPRAQDAANPWPEIDLATDALMSRGRDLGKLEVIARPSGADWQIESLALSTDVGSITAKGWWRAGPPQETKLDIAIEAQEAGAFLARFGMADAVKGAPTKIEGQLAWAGSPSDFDYPSLSGSFKLTSGAGQFLKADPGMGRLLGVLSLQALPRRISLDFRDVFSEGFAFDAVAGAATVSGGIMSTENLRLTGPAASVDISGSVDLSRETEQLRVRVMPSLTSSVSAGAAALFIANPLVGAAVGAGALLAQKLMKDPLEQLFSYEYAVSGGWAEPVVQRVGGRTAAAAAPAQTVTQ